MLTRAHIADHTPAIRDTIPLPAGWPNCGRVWPTAPITQRLRKAGWPCATIRAMLPQHEHRGLRAGQRVADAQQEITVFPATWFRELCRLAGVDYAVCVRGEVPDGV